MDTPSGLQLHVLNLDWSDLGFRYTTQDVWPVLTSADLAQRRLLLEEPDIRTYDWDHQEVWLSDPAIRRLVQCAADKLLRNAVGQAFVVTLDDDRLYGGLFYDQGGAAAIRFPVIHALGEPTIVLRIRPALGYGWAPNEPYLAAQCQAIANPRLFARLSQRDLLGSMPGSQRPLDPWERRP